MTKAAVSSVMLADEVMREFDRCAHDFKYFAKTYLKILTTELLPEEDGKPGKTVTQYVALNLTDNQRRVVDALERTNAVYNLKARKLGTSTVTLAYFFWKVFFVPGFKAGTLAHEDGAVQELFKIVHTFHAHLPDWMKQGPFKLRRQTTHELWFDHGGTYRCVTAGSERFRSSDLNAIHFSEFAKYEKPVDTIAAVVGAALPGCVYVYETTARGLGYAYDLWHDDSAGVERIFLSWTTDKRCRLHKMPPHVEAVPKPVAEIAAEVGLDYEQVNWATVKFLALHQDLATFRQEFPHTAEVAFVVSGDRVFPGLFYPRVAAADRKPGLRTFDQPKPYHTYLLGVDAASGSLDPKSDMSAMCVVDVTAKDCPRLVETFCDRVNTVRTAELVLERAKVWNAFVNVERNTYGLDVVQRLVAEGWPKLYRTQRYEKVNGDERFVDEIGFSTTSKTRPVLIGLLQQYLATRLLDPVCPRLQQEIMDFEYGQTGKPEHRHGAHDDLLFALALALVALPEADFHRTEITRPKRPDSLDEWVALRQVVGPDKLAEVEFDGEEDPGPQPLGSTLDLFRTAVAHS